MQISLQTFQEVCWANNINYNKQKRCYLSAVFIVQP